MTLELYVAIVDTLILLILIVWSYMDRNNIYIKDKDNGKT